MTLTDYLKKLPEDVEVKVTRRENKHKDEYIFDIVYPDGRVDTSISPKSSMCGSKCKICEKRYHVCSSCGISPSEEYLEDGYCSYKCAEKDGWEEPVYDD